MKLRDKKTGAIYKIEDIELGNNADGIWLGTTKYTSLAELNEEWEDYEEPGAWGITMYGGISRITKNDEPLIPDLKEIGNYFNDKESAYDVLEKLKAWKRLKGKGFRFTGYTNDSGDLFSCQVVRCRFDDFGKESREDLYLLFGGEK